MKKIKNLKKMAQEAIKDRKKFVVVEGISFYDNEEEIEYFRYEIFNKVYKKHLKETRSLRESSNTNYLYSAETQAEMFTIQDLTRVGIDVNLCYSCYVTNN